MLKNYAMLGVARSDAGLVSTAVITFMYSLLHHPLLSAFFLKHSGYHDVWTVMTLSAYINPWDQGGKCAVSAM